MKKKMFFVKNLCLSKIGAKICISSIIKAIFLLIKINNKMIISSKMLKEKAKKIQVYLN